jgi:hypothetical protein
VDVRVPALALDKAAPAQAGEVVGDLGLRLAEPFDQLADRQLVVLASSSRIRRRVGSASTRKYFATRSGSAGAGGSRNGVSSDGLAIAAPYHPRVI